MARRNTLALPTLLGSCALILTAHLLGASWLAAPVLGLPLGIWALPPLYALGRWAGRLGLDDALDRLIDRLAPGARTPRTASHAQTTNTRAPAGGIRRIHSPIDRAFSALANRIERAIGAERIPGAAPSSSSSRNPGTDLAPGAGTSRAGAGARGYTPRIAVVLPEHLAAPLIDAAGSDAVAWFVGGESDRIGGGSAGPGGADAVVCAGEAGELVIELASEPGGAPSTWTDWAAPAPASYPGAFPVRLDPERITVGRADLSEPGQARGVRALGDAAVLLRRSASSGPEGEWARHRAGRVLDGLRGAVNSAALRARADEPSRIGARVVSAWALGGWSRLEVEEILESVEGASRLVGDEPVMTLRLAAARLAAGEDERGLAALERAARMLEDAGRGPRVDQVPFVQGDLEVAGEDDELAVGRIAAGLCLCFALAEPGAVGHLSEDLLDDMRYSPVLLGRDQDRAALMRVLRNLERWKRAAGAPGEDAVVPPARDESGEGVERAA